MDQLNEEDDEMSFECAMNTSAITYDKNRLSYVGQDCRALPSVLATLYGPRTLRLDLSFNRLTSLAGVDRFPGLEELVLDNNRLGDAMRVPRLPHLHTLSLNKNNISNLELLLSQLSHNVPALHYLSLLGNPACPDQLSDSESDEHDYRAYRLYVLYHVPGLRFLDFTPVSATERAEAQTRGKFMRVVRPRPGNSAPPADDDLITLSESSIYTPLPSSKRETGEHIGAYSRCKFRYSGKHSEGNRFIQNKDL